jgi:hypothetical protein
MAMRVRVRMTVVVVRLVFFVVATAFLAHGNSPDMNGII